MTDPAIQPHRRVLISVVSPVYKCRECLATLAATIDEAFARAGIDWELILVDDRSPDGAWPVIRQLSATDPRIRGIRLARNHGQQLAIWAGLEAARGSWVSVIDCDLQDDPAVIPALYEKARSGSYESVVVRRGTWTDTSFRRAASRSFHAVMMLLSNHDLRGVGNFGLYGRKVVDALIQFQEQDVFLPIMVGMVGFECGYLEVDRLPRREGRSSYSLLRLIKLAGKVIVRFSDRPLQISVIVGLAFSSLAAVVSIILLVMRFLGWIEVPGWTSIVLSLWFLSGLILAVLGVHGIYLGQVFKDVKRRPRIIVETTTNEPVEFPTHA